MRHSDTDTQIIEAPQFVADARDSADEAEQARAVQRCFAALDRIERAARRTTRSLDAHIAQDLRDADDEHR